MQKADKGLSNFGQDLNDLSANAAQNQSEESRSFSLLGRRAGKKNLLVAFRQLSLLVETGIDVAEALELVAETCKQPALQECILTILDDINGGRSLSAAVDDQKDVLGEEVAASIQAGEASGQLVEVLRQIASQLDEELQMQATIRGALAYPSILSCAALAVGAILIWFVLPQFETSFSSMGVDPPQLTQVLLGGAAFIRENVLFVATGVVTLIGGGVLAFMQDSTRKLCMDIAFASPVIGTALRNLAIGRLFVSISHLLGNGISLLEAIQLVRVSSVNTAVDRMTASWERDVIEGRGFTQNLDEFDFLPDGAEAMLVMAEKTGKLESVMSTAGNHYRMEGTQQLKSILKMSEPAIIILLGAFVGTVVASVLLPILDVQSAGSAN